MSVVLLLLSLIGIVVCVLLGEQSVFSADAICGIDGGCNQVTKSDYASIAGIPLWLIGLGQYLMLFGLSSLCLIKSKVPPIDLQMAPLRSLSIKLRLLLSVAGGLASLYFIYLQGVVIGSWCPLCLTSAGLHFLILGLAWYEFSTYKLKLKATFPAIVAPVLMAVMIGVLLWGIHGWAEHQRAMNQESQATQYPSSPEFSVSGKQFITVGESNAPNEIIYFGSLSCDHCKKAHHIIDELFNEYGEAKLRVVFLNPYDPENEDHSESTHLLMRARYAFAEQNTYAAYVSWVYELSQDMPLDKIPVEALESLIDVHQLSYDRWISDLNSVETKQNLQREWDLLQRLNLEGLPTVFINGVKTTVDKEAMINRMVIND